MTGAVQQRELNARKFVFVTAASLGLLVLAVAVVVSTAGASHSAAFVRPLVIPPELRAADVTLTAQEADVQILDGAPTRMWTFNGTFPGPTIRRPAGQATRVTVVNQLPAAAGSLTLHNHGNHSAPAEDGQPDSFLVPTGGSRTYTYSGIENGSNERGATQWYHDHRMDTTGRNVWMGLAGMYIIEDDEALGLPAGEFDVPLLITDRSFDSANQLSYSFDATGVTGDHLLVNGVVQPHFEVGDRRYRFRILNASNIRDYELELSNGAQLTQIGTEAGLLPAPVSRQQILIGPAERVDVVIDFSGLLGQNVVLLNRAGRGATSEIMQFRVRRDLTDGSTVPASLRPLDTVGEPTVTRVWDFGRKNGAWTINGLPFNTSRVDAQPVLGTTEKWVLRNTGGWSHVVHIHDVDQQLISRNGAPPGAHELTKESWHIGGGQTVEVKLRFTDHVGKYVLHCHVLEHEDMAMMSQFEVVPSGAGAGDTGLIAATTQAAGAGNGFEGSPDAAFADGAGFAANLDGPGDSHIYSGYGVSIPAGSAVVGIEARVDWWLDSVVGSSSLDVALSSDGVTWTAPKVDTRESSRERSVVLGGGADTWGRAWTSAEISSLRVRVTATSDRSVRDFFLDWIPVRIFYR